MKKDDIIELHIEDMGIDGEGIGKIEGIPIFVKDAVIGDSIVAKIMKMKKNYGYARLMEIKKTSPYRVTPRCKWYRQCGGCQIQSLEYQKQLEFKERKVKNDLMRIGGFNRLEDIMESIIGMEEPFRYRNKAQFPVGIDKNGKIITGFYAGRTHSIVANTSCFLGTEENETILNHILAFMEKYKIEPYNEKTGRGLVRHILIRTGFYTGEIMVCIVINGKKLPYSEELVEKLKHISGMTSITININQKNTNVILGEDLYVLWGKPYITDKIGDIQYQISPLSFFQVNAIQTRKLYEVALEYAGLSGGEIVWDLYCGIGTISLFLAQKAGQVNGVEVVPQAVENARSNQKLNGIDNVEFFLGKAEEVLPEFYEQESKKKQGSQMLHPDVIVVDPPRKGCDEKCLETIVKMQANKVVYVSCNSATLARDLKYLCEKGYELRKVRPVDMFPQTVSIENVCLLVRGCGK